MQALPHATDDFRPFPKCLDVSAALSEADDSGAAENLFLRKQFGLFVERKVNQESSNHHRARHVDTMASERIPFVLEMEISTGRSSSSPPNVRKFNKEMAVTMREWIGDAEQHDDLTFVVVALK
jgi:hypothetical protein